MRFRNVHFSRDRYTSPIACFLRFQLYRRELATCVEHVFFVLRNSTPPTAHAPFFISQNAALALRNYIVQRRRQSGCVLVSRVSTNLGLFKICPFINRRSLLTLRNARFCQTTSPSCPAHEIAGAKASQQR